MRHHRLQSSLFWPLLRSEHSHKTVHEHAPHSLPLCGITRSTFSPFSFHLRLRRTLPIFPLHLSSTHHYARRQVRPRRIRPVRLGTCSLCLPTARTKPGIQSLAAPIPARDAFASHDLVPNNALPAPLPFSNPPTGNPIAIISTLAPAPPATATLDAASIIASAQSVADAEGPIASANFASDLSVAIAEASSAAAAARITAVPAALTKRAPQIVAPIEIVTDADALSLISELFATTSSVVAPTRQTALPVAVTAPAFLGRR
jgi:hypothetical protein